MAVSKTTKKDTSQPVKKQPLQTKEKTKAAPAKEPTPKKAATAKAKANAKPKDMSKMEAPKAHQEKVKTTATGKTAYHVSKRDNDGREWKVFIQGSDKVIKLFETQKEALDYAKSLAKNKDDGSYVILHGLDGKIRKY